MRKANIISIGTFHPKHSHLRQRDRPSAPRRARATRTARLTPPAGRDSGCARSRAERRSSDSSSPMPSGRCHPECGRLISPHCSGHSLRPRFGSGILQLRSDTARCCSRFTPLSPAESAPQRPLAAWTPKRAAQRSANHYFPSLRGAEEADVLSRGGSGSKGKSCP